MKRYIFGKFLFTIQVNVLLIILFYFLSEKILIILAINAKLNLQFDPEWCADTLNIEQNNTIVKKQSMLIKLYLIIIILGTQHGIVFCKNNLDINTPYIEFKINMNIPCRGKSHLFIGLVDRSKYKIENLSNKNLIFLFIFLISAIIK